jgi:ATP-binding cassette, subfamily A (ABC1), member 3
MAAERSSVFIRQTWALTRKTLLIVVVRHWVSTIVRALILPIAFLVLLLNIKNFLDGNNTYGVGSPAPVQSLKAAIPDSRKLVFVQTAGLGADAAIAVDTIANPLRATKQLVFLTDEDDLLTTCKENLRGISDCFAAVVINDSPLTVGKQHIWNYTIRADNRWNGFGFHVDRHNNDEDTVYLPLQVALENAITNSTVAPNEYMFTSITQETADTQHRQHYQSLIISTYSIAFLISTVSVVYHAVGMITAERESCMSELIDAMGGSGASRVLSYVLAFDLIYLPCWIIFGICEYPLVLSAIVVQSNPHSVLGPPLSHIQRCRFSILAAPRRLGAHQCGHLLRHVLQPCAAVRHLQYDRLPHCRVGRSPPRPPQSDQTRKR